MGQKMKPMNVFVAMGIMILTGCANLSPGAQSPQPTVDHNAMALIDRVKAEPSRLSGGGMIYELFVGGHFNAKFDQREGTLTLADMETHYSCQYGIDGLLKLPENTGAEHITFCTELSANTVALLSQ